MEWENNDNGRQRWCVRLVQGGGFGGPLFDGFDNLYVGQPGALLSFPPTQWTRWRKPVIGMPSTPRFLGRRPPSGRHPPGTGAGVRRPSRRGGRHRGRLGGRRRPRRCDARAGRLRAGPAGLPGRGRTRLLGGQRHGGARRLAAGRSGRGAGRAEVPLGADGAGPRVDQRRRQRRGAGQPGVVRRRVDRLRQRPRPTAVGAARRRRETEMVGAAGVSGANATRGHPAGPDRVGRRPGHPAGGVPRRR